jgi:hypothetical protein
VRIAALVAAALLAVAGCGSSQESEPTMVTETSASPPGQSNGPLAPATEGETLDGQTLSLADFHGRPVFVNVWASW